MRLEICHRQGANMWRSQGLLTTKMGTALIMVPGLESVRNMPSHFPVLPL